MTRSTPTRRRSNARKTPISPRAVILAGIGAVSLGRKQAQAKFEEADVLVRQARTKVESALTPVLVKLGVRPGSAERAKRAAPASRRPRKRA